MKNEQSTAVDQIKCYVLLHVEYADRRTPDKGRRNVIATSKMETIVRV